MSNSDQIIESKYFIFAYTISVTKNKGISNFDKRREISKIKLAYLVKNRVSKKKAMYLLKEHRLIFEHYF
jgi:hypothetical protein